MNSTLVDDFLKHDLIHQASVLGVTVDDFKLEPSVSKLDPSSNCILQIVRFGELSVVVTTPEWKDPVARMLQAAPWKEWLDSPPGLHQVLAALGLQTMDTTPRPGGPVHNIGLLCGAARFRPYEKHADRIVRIAPDHPLWADPEAAPKWPFKYVIVEKGQIIAQAIMKHNLEVLGGRIWALGVFVKPEHRRRGYGKAVVSAATRQVVEGGGLGLWNAWAHNLASLALCQALGYEKFFWEICIPSELPADSFGPAG